MSVKTEFHVGDRVIVTGVQNGLEQAVGREGTVVYILSYSAVNVQFDERFSPRLHSGNRNDYSDPNRRCWQYENTRLQFAYLDLPSPEDVDALL